MDALFSEWSRPWTSLGFGHGCSVLRTDELRTDETMDVIRLWALMLSSQNG